MFEDYDRGEKQQKAGMFRARIIIFVAIAAVTLIALGITKWYSYSLHKKLSQRHSETTAYFINVFPNGRPPNAVYVITYVFMVDGKSYQNTAETRISPRNTNGVVFYNPDDPNENELQPISP